MVVVGMNLILTLASYNGVYHQLILGMGHIENLEPTEVARIRHRLHKRLSAMSSSPHPRPAAMYLAR